MSSHDVPPAPVHVRGYLTVFGALLVLTLITVAVSYVQLPMTPTVLIALAIASA